MKTRFYYTFEDISHINEDAESTIGAIVSNIGFYEFLASKIGSTDTDTDYTRNLFQYYVQPILSELYIDYIDVEHDEYTEVDKPDVSHSKLLTQMYVLLKKTQPFYEERIKRLEKYADQLMNEVSNKTVAKFNDTPQSEGEGFDTDPYTSNITTTENSNQPGTIADRINNANTAVINYYNSWADEFNKFVILGEDESWTRK